MMLKDKLSDKLPLKLKEMPSWAYWKPKKMNRPERKGKPFAKEKLEKKNREDF